MMPADLFRPHAMFRLSAAVLVAVLLAGCGASRVYRKGSSAARTGDWDAAVEQYQRAVQMEPNRPDYRIALERAMLSASLQHLDQARLFEAKTQLEEALREYRRASEYDPPNRQLAAKVSEIERRLRDQAEASARARSNIEQMREAARRAGPQPLFNLKTVLPAIRLSDTSTRTILNAIAQAAGINVQYDSTFNDRPFSVNLENVTLEDALNQVLLANGLFFKVLNPRTIIVAQESLANRTKYEDQVIRTFYISNGDATDLSQLLNQIVRIGGQQLQPQIVPNKTANSITVRGSATLVDIVEKVIEANDNPRAEIIVDVQLLEVNRRRAKQFGLDLGTYAINAAFSPETDARGISTGTTATGATTATGTELVSRPFNVNTVTRGISTADFYAAVPAALIRFLATDAETKVIAKPQLRGAEGQKLSLNLGEEIPIPATTFTPLASGGANFNPLTSFNYKKVGVNIEMTPRVTVEGDIILELMVENSARGGDVPIAGTNYPSFVSRVVNTKLRLRDGESNLLAGLLSESERKSMKGFPGLLHLPIISQLFAANDTEMNQTDIVMLLTPRIVRTQEISQADLNPLYIGTGTYMALGGAPALIALPDDATPNGAVAPALTPGVTVPTPAPGGPISVIPPGSGPIPGTTTLQPAPAVAAPPQPLPVPAQPPVTGAAPAAPPVAAPTPTPAAPAGGQVLISPPGTEFRAGAGPYTVPISVTGVSRLSSVSLTVTYNPAVLRVRTVQEGSFMRSGGANATFTQQADATNGRVDIVIVRSADTTGVAGTGLLAALLFDTVAPGSSNLTISGTATVPGGAALPLQFAPPATVTVR